MTYATEKKTLNSSLSLSLSLSLNFLWLGLLFTFMNGGELLDAPLDVARLELGQGKERKGFGGGRTFTLVGWGTTERHEQSSFFKAWQ